MSNEVGSFEEGWNFIHKGIMNILDGLPKPHFTYEDYMLIYSVIYAMCYQKPPGPYSSYAYSDKLYEKYKELFEEYIKSTVVPSLRGKKDELLLKEVLERWSNHKTMTRYLSKLFHLLDSRHHFRGLKLPSVKETAFLSFYSLVYDEMNKQVMDAILAMIDQKRAGKPIDDQLVNGVLTFYLELGEITRKDELKHFAETMIKENAIESMSFGIFKLEI